MTAKTTLSLRYLQGNICVTTDAVAHLEWLRECLDPHFAVERSIACAWNVTFSEDAHRYERLAALRTEQAADSFAFFTLDSRVVRLPGWNGNAGELVAFDEEFDVFITVREAERTVAILTRTLRPWSRMALLRVVRELAMEEAYATGGIFLHAAAFEHNDAAYVIAGPKNAGKTTLLIHALTSDPVRFVANDRVLLTRSDAGTGVRGMPTLVNVRAGTRATFARYFDNGCFGPDDGCLSRAEHATTNRSIEAPSDGALVLNPRQFADALRVSSSIGARLGAIIFPVISSAQSGIEVEALPAETARDWLASTLFPSVARSGARSAFGGTSRSAAVEHGCLSDLATGGMPILRCTLGTNAYARGYSIIELLQARSFAC